MPFTSINTQLIYPIGIRGINYIVLAIVPSVAVPSPAGPNTYGIWVGMQLMPSQTCRNFHM